MIYTEKYIEHINPERAKNIKNAFKVIENETVKKRKKVVHVIRENGKWRVTNNAIKDDKNSK